MATKYKNTGGRHTCMDGTVVATGETFVDADDNLCSKFTGKFESMGKVDVQEPLPASETTDPPKTETDSTKPDTDHSTVDGVDVTAEFAAAVNNDLKVVKVKNGWIVYDSEGVPINDTPLKKKKEVEDVINEWIED